MAPPRVRESCIPCRQRKSRCNEESPCSSCVLRGTESDCQLPSTSGAPGPSRRPAQPRPPRHSAGNSPTHAHRSSASPPRRQHSNTHAELPVTPGERETWDRFIGTLPPRATCEILLEYLTIECDWLWHFGGDILATWQHAISRQGIDRATAGVLYASLALPSSLLAEGHPLYRIPRPPGEAEHLFALAQGCVPEVPQTIQELELYIGLMNYAVYHGGSAPRPHEFTLPAIQAGMKFGLFDESGPAWNGLSNEERSRWRRVGLAFVSIQKWSQFYGTPDPFANTRINLCRPELVAIPITRPVVLDLPAPHNLAAKQPDATFRVLRIRSRDELDRVYRLRHIMSDIADVIPRVQSYLRKVGKVDSDILLSECELLYRDLQAWWEVRLPQQGFAVPAVQDLDPTDIVSCRYASQSLVLSLAIGHISANLLRHWLEVSDITASSPSPHRRLYAACLDNAKRCMETIPLIKALVKSRQGPIIVSFMAGNLFNAATSYAIPVLRAVRHWTARDTQPDIASLPHWPGDDPRNPPQRTTNTAPGHLPMSIYSDSTVKECATNILVILDGLSELKANPLGQQAEKRLGALIAQYGLRDAQSAGEQYAFDPSFNFVGHTPKSVEEIPFPGQNQNAHTGLNDQMFGVSTQTADDFSFLNSLLQMDGSIWEGLMEAGAISGLNGQSLG